MFPKKLSHYKGKKQETENVKTFVFETEADYEYVAGQFTYFEFEFQGNMYNKHFTISNSPTRHNLELTTIVSDSDYKQALDSLEKGTPVHLTEAMGAFTLDSRKTDDLVFLVGGIGITPVRSILQFVADTDEKELDITIFYSNRNQKRIVFRQELDRLAKEIGSVDIIHTLTDSEWEGETGYIDERMLTKYLDEGSYSYYVVGPPAFNDAMSTLLKEKLDVDEEYLILENFAGY